MRMVLASRCGIPVYRYKFKMNYTVQNSLCSNINATITVHSSMNSHSWPSRAVAAYHGCYPPSGPPATASLSLVSFFLVSSPSPRPSFISIFDYCSPRHLFLRETFPITHPPPGHAVSRAIPLTVAWPPFDTSNLPATKSQTPKTTSHPIPSPFFRLSQLSTRLPLRLRLHRPRS